MKSHCLAALVLTLSSCAGPTMSIGEHVVAHKVAELPDTHHIVPPAVTVIPDGSVLAVRTADNAIKVWNWRQHRLLATLQLPRGANDRGSGRSIQFSPAGDLLASCHTRGSDNTPVVIWDTPSWRVAHRIVDAMPGSGCNALAFTPDGQFMIRLLQRFQSLPGPTLIVYRTADWQQVAALRTNPFFGSHLAVSPDGASLAIGGSVSPPGSEDDTSAANPFMRFDSEDGSRIVLLDRRSLEIRSSFRTASAIRTWSSLAWSADGRTIAHAAGHGVQVFDVASGTQSYRVAPVTGIAQGTIWYTGDGRYLLEAQGRGGNGLRIRDQTRHALLQNIDGEFDAVAASADGRIMAATTMGKTLVWRLNP